MFLALVGAITSLALPSRPHDRQLPAPAPAATPGSAADVPVAGTGLSPEP
ncbi:MULTISPECIES: hypothetical protein [Micromonospora]|nr:hypothetical protein [Micromonospora sp. MH33]PSK63698.1 hypothetical protein B0E53_04375 [Micromonospora sp. MH33]